MRDLRQLRRRDGNTLGWCGGPGSASRRSTLAVLAPWVTPLDYLQENNLLQGVAESAELEVRICFGPPGARITPVLFHMGKGAVSPTHLSPGPRTAIDSHSSTTNNRVSSVTKHCLNPFLR